MTRLRTRPLFTTALALMLYAALPASVNPAGAAGLSPGDRDAIIEMRTGDMRKLVIHKEPRAPAEIGFTDEAGNALHFNDTNGQLRVVNFWATWCAPCRAEMPTLDRLSEARPGSVLAIATGRNTLSGLKSFNAETGVEHLPILLDPKGALARSLGVLGLPTTLILDAEGREIARLQGEADWFADETLAVLDALQAALDS
ncbi:TlpA family protein disulfide reductase [Oceanomicrobium pacificus]|uniref:Redoxin family protein n=1 Tax=Oceanomicrobium pacificus TaxID=2692916 RepID=A0A6B0THW5_9RHOB|nr:TlpA disulfide reductase family protein [Oceanomicrobium pacificus]MXU63990.1 redoxin family protein [Oceanomicrobium pacificus]